MTSNFVEIVPLSHRQRNCIPFLSGKNRPVRGIQRCNGFAAGQGLIIEVALAEQSAFVAWWDGSVGKNWGGDRSKNADLRSCSAEEAEELMP